MGQTTTPQPIGYMQAIYILSKAERLAIAQGLLDGKINTELA